MRNLSLFILLILIVFVGCEALNNPEELLSDDTGTVGVLEFDQDSYAAVWNINNKPSFTLTLKDSDLDDSIKSVIVTIESSKAGTSPVPIELKLVSPGVYEYTGVFYTDHWSNSELLINDNTVTLTAIYADETPKGMISQSVEVTLILGNP